mmetsp:Transcript_93239/g.161389  ORF Transcript_93239/g.161389 Transcript_93239/m.161389 type:complete len:260 (-) Transcript_93239:297-1076(-)
MRCCKPCTCSRLEPRAFIAFTPSLIVRTPRFTEFFAMWHSASKPRADASQPLPYLASLNISLASVAAFNASSVRSTFRAASAIAYCTLAYSGAMPASFFMSSSTLPIDSNALSTSLPATCVAVRASQAFASPFLSSASLKEFIASSAASVAPSTSNRSRQILEMPSDAMPSILGSAASLNSMPALVRSCKESFFSFAGFAGAATGSVAMRSTVVLKLLSSPRLRTMHPSPYLSPNSWVSSMPSFTIFSHFICTSRALST